MSLSLKDIDSRSHFITVWTSELYTGAEDETVVELSRDYTELIEFLYSLLQLTITTWTVSVVLWSEFPTTDTEDQVRFPELPDFLRSSGSEKVSTQPHEYNLGGN
jgi:hypothetical protein